MAHLGDMAYFPGTGPDDTRCAECTFYYVRKNPPGRCRKAAELRRTTVMKMEPIPGNTDSCKFWVKV